jgi:cardiolipin hydrolase
MWTFSCENMNNFVVAAASLASLATGIYVGYNMRIWKKQTTTERRVSCNEVVFFPDNVTAASDRSLSREAKGMLYKEILGGSGPLEVLVQHLSSATESIDLCLYIITCHKLGGAVIRRLTEANVRVRLIVDEGSAHLNGSMVSELRKQGVFVRMKKMDYLMHHKFAIIDKRMVLSGSFNWTMQAVMGNHENIIISSEPTLVQPFNQHFEAMWQEFA